MLLGLKTEGLGMGSFTANGTVSEEKLCEQNLYDYKGRLAKQKHALWQHTGQVNKDQPIDGLPYVP